MNYIIVARAREWIDTPFVHQGRAKGVGVDCMGVCIDALGLQAYDRTDYSMTPDGKGLVKEIEKHMLQVQTDCIEPGDLLQFNIAGNPQHFGIFTGTSIVHAYAAIGFVREHRMDETWRRRLFMAWRLPCS